ncbi:MAG: oxygen-dependent coproporphyrinogen oxidase [Cyclobacteriaceae bacterium]
MDKDTISNWFKNLQSDITSNLEKIDGSGIFSGDTWKRSEGGGGHSMVIENGDVFEKGGVNWSAVHGNTPQKILDALKLEAANFFATGVSIVIHPHSPHVPIIHMNVRYFEMSNGVWWFGGGIDLTPIYVNDDDAAHFHRKLKETCDRHNVDCYPQYKKWADDYFFIKHRNETRGIGGIFFDRLSSKHGTKKELFSFVQNVGNTFIPVYKEIVYKNKDLIFDDNQKKWQYLRRGRYVEFNLVLDKGTKFGLDTDGRTESILMSLPPQANWAYNYKPETGSPEWDTLQKLKKGMDWVNK